MCWLLHLLAFGLLTVLTQVGGLVYLLYLPLGGALRRRVSGWKGWWLGAGGFVLLLMVVSLWVVPPLARRAGRVPLPLSPTAEMPLAPGRWFTILANRRYVRPKLLGVIRAAAQKTAERYPGTELRYLDANFPFLTGFPLLPHRSHDDGEKLDLSFLYVDAQGGRRNASPGFLGYGFVEAPAAGERDQPAICGGQGYRQYSLLKYLARERSDLRFDAAANAWLVGVLTADPRVGKLFVEPHLKARQGHGENPKVRYHGCAAVRHDDHIHVQLQLDG